MTFSQALNKAGSDKDLAKKLNVNISHIQQWKNGILPDYKQRNFILRTIGFRGICKDSDGFIFEGNRAGKNTKYNINNKMKYYYSDDWKKVQERKMKSVGYKCEICGSKDNLVCHHLIYDENWGGKEKNGDLLCVCKLHHMYQHLDKPECVKIIHELESPVREIVVNIRSDYSVSAYVFTDCDDSKIKKYMVDLYNKLKITKYIKNCKLYKTKLEGKADKQNNRWFSIAVHKNQVVEIHQCNSKENAQKYKKPNLLSFTVLRPNKTIDSDKLNQIS